MGHTGEVNAVTFSPDGALLASVGGFSGDRGSHDFTVRLWDAATRTEVARLRGHEERIISLAFSPDGATLASGSMDRTVRLWDVATRTLRTTLDAYSVRTVSFSPDGATLVYGAQDGVWLRDMETGSAVLLPGHEAILNETSVALSPDGALLAAAHEGIPVKLWDLRTLEPAGTLPLEGHPATGAVAFSPDGTSLAGGSFISPRVPLWDVATRELIGTLEGGQGGGVSDISFSPAGPLLASGSRGGAINLWNVETRQLTATLEGHTTRIMALAFSPDGALLASAGYWAKSIVLWDVAAQEPVATLEGGAATSSGFVFTAIAFSPDGALLAAGTGANVVLWDVATRERIVTLETRGTSLAFSPDGTILATPPSYDRRQISLWDVATRQIASTLDVEFYAAGLVFSTDERLISWSSDATTLLWDLQPRPQTVTDLSGHRPAGVAGAALTEPFVVLVLDQHQDPLAGATVTFTVTAGGGTLSATTDTTDADGRASTTLTLGRQPGPNTVQATVDGLEPVTFTATGLAVARTLEKVSGDVQEGSVGTALADPFVVVVRDQNGLPLAGVQITFAVTGGGGTLSATTATTDADGRAATTLTLGPTPGINTVEALIAGLEPVTFTATAEATPDFDGDGVTGFSDFFLFAEAFGGSDPRFDLDGSGTVDFTDFFLFAEHFGQPARAKLVAMARELIGLPDGPQLRQNAPNPFNSQTVISWFQLQPGTARLEVFALTGQRVAVLHRGPKKAGVHRVSWAGRDDRERPLASGVYLYRLVTPERVHTRKLTLLR